MKRKVLNAKFKKQSETYPEYFKYDLEIQEVDGTINHVPAYGKDLQDALSRVVKKEKVTKLRGYLGNSILFLAIIFMAYVTGITYATIHYETFVILIIGIIAPIIANYVIKLFIKSLL